MGVCVNALVTKDNADFWGGRGAGKKFRDTLPFWGLNVYRDL